MLGECTNRLRGRRTLADHIHRFVSKQRLELKDKQWQMLLRYVAVEVLALRKAGRDVNQACLPRSTTLANFERSRTAIITRDASSSSIAFRSPEVERELLQAIPETHDGSEQKVVDAKELRDVASKDPKQSPSSQDHPSTLPGWLYIPLQDPEIKLAVRTQPSSTLSIPR